MNILKQLTEFSNRYGNNPEFVLAGGGNTSAKDGDILYVKGSGIPLADITASGFVRMDRKKLKEVLNGAYSEDTSARERGVLTALSAARMPGEENKRPSVETSLHDMLKSKFVLHVHPPLVNGATCSVDGKKAIAELFPQAAWVDATKAGYILAADSKKVIDDYGGKHGIQPAVLFVENHGVFFSADTVSGLDSLVADVMDKLRCRARIIPNLSDAGYNPSLSSQAAETIRTAYLGIEGAAATVFACNYEIALLARNTKYFAAVEYPFTPDHIVYCRHKALFINDALPQTVSAAFSGYRKENGFAPKIVFVKKLGMFASGKNAREAETARDVFTDGIKIAVYAKNFGGGKFMTSGDIKFILNWEAESYRQKISIGNNKD